MFYICQSFSKNVNAWYNVLELNIKDQRSNVEAWHGRWCLKDDFSIIEINGCVALAKRVLMWLSRFWSIYLNVCLDGHTFIFWVNVWPGIDQSALNIYIWHIISSNIDYRHGVTIVMSHCTIVTLYCTIVWQKCHFGATIVSDIIIG